MNKKGLWRSLGVLAMGVAVLVAGSYSQVRASDHDDGETGIKARNLSLTDLYVFREDWQTGNAADAQNLILVMGTNPRSLARQQYFFNTNAQYNFHFTRQTNRNAPVTGQEDIRMSFTFGAPDATASQAISMTVTGANGTNPTTVSAGRTTPAPILLSNQQPGINNPTLNTATSGGRTFTVFAGLREDPFFFDVDAYFRTRALVGGNVTTPSATNPPGFGTIATAKDFAKGYNINAIVVRVPIAALQTAAAETVFDVWETITLPSNIAAFQN